MPVALATMALLAFLFLSRRCTWTSSSVNGT